MAPKGEYAARLERVRKRMKEAGIGVLLAHSIPGSLRFGCRGHVLYLSGYEPYTGTATVILPVQENLSLSLLIEGWYSIARGRRFSWISDVHPAGDVAQSVADILRRSRVIGERIGLAGHYTMNPLLLERLKENLGTALVLVPEILEGERAVKSRYEINCIQRACKIADEGFNHIGKTLKPGMNEFQIIAEIEYVSRKKGSEDFPHHTMASITDSSWSIFPQGVKAKRGKPVGVDFGTMVNGYCCDVTRTFVPGRASKLQRDIFEVVLEAQDAALKALKPGVSTDVIDLEARRVIREAGFGRWEFNYGIGHGLGLEVHEWPFMGRSLKQPDEPAYRAMKIREGMVVTLEPAIYHPEAGGIGIEDEVLITSTGNKLLSQFPRELVEVS